jgi:tetratricopeptide (TPR) repeat protein
LKRGVPWLVGGVGAGVGLLFAYSGSDPLSGYSEKSFTLWERLLTQPRVVLEYVSLVLWPLPSRLSLMHTVETSTSLWSPWTTSVALVGVIAAGVLGTWCVLRGRWPIVGFGLLWFGLQLLVESTVLPLEMMYEHRVYLPLAGVAPMFSWWVVRGSQRLGRTAGSERAVCAVAGIALVALLASAAHARNQVWSDPILLWTDSLDKSDHVRARVNLGVAYFKAERYEDAVEHLERIVGQDPRRDSAWTTLAAAKTHLGRIDEAVEDYRAALRAEPTNAMARSGLGGLLVSQGKSEEGIEELGNAIKLRPDERFALNLGLALGATGEPDEAEEMFWLAIDIAPNFVRAYEELAKLLLEQGRAEEALAPLVRVVALRPSAAAHARLASAAWSEGRWLLAVRAYGAAYRLDPRTPAHANDLAWALAAVPRGDLRQPSRALALALQAVAAERDASALDTQAVALAASGRHDDAVRVAREAYEMARASGNRRLAAEVARRIQGYERAEAFVQSSPP